MTSLLSESLAQYIFCYALNPPLRSNKITGYADCPLFSVMSTKEYPILILMFIPSLEELKDLIDKPDLMKSFVIKDESVSY